MKDQVSSYFSKDLKVRASVIVTTSASRELCRRFNATPVASMAIGRVLSGAGLLAAHAGKGQMVGVHFNGDGPIGVLYGEATHEGGLRGYCTNPNLMLIEDEKLPDKGLLSVKRAVGKGVLTVTRSAAGSKQPFVGNVPIATGEIASDLAFYLQQSFQIPSLVSLGVFIEKDGQVVTSGGVLIELLPGADESVIQGIEKRAAQAKWISTRMQETESVVELLQDYVGNILMDEPFQSREVELRCRCTQERFENALVMLGEASIQDQLAAGKPIQARCEFCGKSYTIDTTRLLEIAARTSFRN